MVPKRVLSFATAAAFALTGCASFVPKDGPNGEKLVFVDYIKRSGGVSPLANNGAFAGVGAAAGPIGAAVGAGFDVLFGTAATATGAGNIEIVYVNYDKTKESGPHFLGGDFMRRSAWPGSELLYPKSWAILTADEKGKIILPCETPCEPVN